MLVLNADKTILEGDLKLSDCERPFVVRWLSGSSQASFFIGDTEALKDDIEAFISGKKICDIDLDAYLKYLDQIKVIAEKYKTMYHGPLDYIDGIITRFSHMSKADAKLVMWYERDLIEHKKDRYIRILNNRSNKSVNEPIFGSLPLQNGDEFRFTFVGGITHIKITKKDENYTISISLNENWRDVIMEEKGKKVDLDSIIDIFNGEMATNIADGKSETESAQIFGIKYGPLLKNNESKFTFEDIVAGSHYNSDDVKKAVENGLALSPSVLWKPGLIEEDAAPIGASPSSSPVKETGGCNRIYYGAPGCGKSFIVNKALDDIPVDKKNRFRTTFHPEYSNSDFVGQILPTIEEQVDPTTGDKKEVVKYVFNPGPFTLALQRANDTNDMVYLVIEEINRGNAAAIFGDLFQLLDRKDNSSPRFGESQYPICNPVIQKYLGLGDGEELIIPSNLTILATMNSSDQNVFTLDTAFKRRWAFEQISNDIVKDTEHKYKNWYIPGTNVTWETFLKTLNDAILDNKIQNQTNEDKRLGKYFVDKSCLTEHVEDIANVQDAAHNFAYKVLEYVWNDVCKIGKEEWFDVQKNKTLEDLIEHFMHPDTANGETPLSVFVNPKF
jgi:hypothetical protein